MDLKALNPVVATAGRDGMAQGNRVTGVEWLALSPR